MSLATGVIADTCWSAAFCSRAQAVDISPDAVIRRMAVYFMVVTP
jgi:hypothetical protein